MTSAAPLPVYRRPKPVWQRLVARPVGLAALLVLATLALVAVLAPYLSPKDPNFLDLMNAGAPPDADHLLGSDSAGRDILSRLIWGSRTTLSGVVITVVTALLAGVPTGMAAGYFGGRTDAFLSWISDVMQAVPAMIILLVVAAGSRSNFVVLMAAVGIIMAPGYFRVARAAARSVSREDYITAAQVAGLGHGVILRRHVAPGILAAVTIQTALAAGIAMGIQAGLQFLGIGQSNVPSWGAMMADGFRFMLTNPWLLFWPSLALGVAIAALALLGSTLADVMRSRSPRPADAAEAVADGAAAPATSAPELDAGAESALRVDNLRVRYRNGGTVTEVVHGISFSVRPGEVLGIVGESGSGKSQTVYSLLDLLPANGASTADGIYLRGKPIHALPEKERARLLGSAFGYVPQEPMSNLDPSYRIGHQLCEPLMVVHGLGRGEARARVRDVLAKVGIRDIDRVMRSYPHEISGGMAQRVLIAGAILGQPSVLLADEPTTALDVTVQAEVLQLLRDLRAETGMALVLITHNFGVVADLCDRVIVMRGGHVIESGPVAEIFAHARHPYTRALIEASADIETSRRELDRMARRTESEAVQG